MADTVLAVTMNSKSESRARSPAAAACFYLVALSVLVCGCQPFGNGVAPLAYYGETTKGLDTAAMAAGGAHAWIAFEWSLGAEPIAFASVASTDESVATFSLDENGNIQVVSGMPGTTELRLLDASNKELLRAPVTVAATQQLAPDSTFADTPYVALADTAQSSHVMHLTTIGSDGPLVGGGAVTFTADGTIQTLMNAQSNTVPSDQFGFLGSVGQGAIHASCLGASLDVSLTFVNEEAVTEVDATPASLVFQTGYTPTNNTVVIRAHAGDTPVADPACKWVLDGGLSVESDDPSIALPAVGDTTLPIDPALPYSFYGPPGNYFAACWVGTARALISITITK